MNRAVCRSSTVQQQTVEAGGGGTVGGTGWWKLSDVPPSSSSSNLLPWHDQSSSTWTQLLLEGTMEEDGRSCSFSDAPTPAKVENNWEDQVLQRNIAPQMAPSNSSSTLWNHHQIDSPVLSSPTSCLLDQGKHPRTPQTESVSTTTGFKKARLQGTSSSSGQSTFKVRPKEKLGDRVTALHRLVSPFGKTDTASVLLEAIGYIRFLQSQIEVLSSPYMGTTPGNTKNLDEMDDKDLKSRGLCLIPVSYSTILVGGYDDDNANGADHWSSPTLGNEPTFRY